ncbi:hypothetical protein [Corynebacterium guangdongense]|uniref:Adhesin domain-containing protein n=1 Tax=Corynebacterium guangdongense TaxID=1783348 RepID=A0ABU1ZY47_9CORY|nr:hypothetical protein [Corynebacterium guangdongense]MDR7329858.1 hypothetical protein [Corynebacterium guangdongense]WJZ18421.1 hypothetical protein CGUA_09310 [Corynebacterium guangdongense]
MQPGALESALVTTPGAVTLRLGEGVVDLAAGNVKIQATDASRELSAGPSSKRFT